MPEPILQSISVFTVWLLGLSMGLTACTATCLPFMGTWVIGRGGAKAVTLRDTAVFIAGRMIAYTVLGGFAAGAGQWLATTLKGGVGHLVIGIAGIVAGVLLLESREGHSPCGVRRRMIGAPPFVIGFALSLTPCVPLASLLAVCTQAGNVPAGMGYGFSFALGAAVTPMLILLPLLGGFGLRMREGRPWLARWARCGAALVLLSIGVRRLLFFY